MHPEPSPGLREAWDTFRERFEWGLAQHNRCPDDHEQARITAADIETFLAEWTPHIADPKLLPHLEHLALAARGPRRSDHLVDLARLLTALKARLQWHLSEALLRSTFHAIELIKEAPPHLRPQLHAACTGKDGETLDAAKRYRKAEADAESAEAAFRQSLAALETDFPALATPALRSRLTRAHLPECEEWADQIIAEIHAFKLTE